MKNNRITADVHFAWTEIAKYMLQSGFLPAGATARDLEILANSRYCEKCGTIWEAATYDGCPICRGLDAVNEDVSTYIEDAMDAMDEAVDALECAAKAIKKGRSYEN